MKADATKTVMSIVGARPNFVKIAPIARALERCAGIRHVIVHTGQHYDEKMSKLFFEDLEIPRPDINLEVGSGSHAAQTARIMERIEPAILEWRPDLLLVVGDVNSTIACALTAVKLGVDVAHVEAGLRSFDREMPEEINRVLTDAISRYHFITEAEARENLLREGISADGIFFTGNVMIDTLLRSRERAERSSALEDFGLSKGAYGLVTLHRPSNVDERASLAGIMGALAEIGRRLELVFPCHPRTQARLAEFGLSPAEGSGVRICNPIGYLDFMRLVSCARLVLTDSGGLQEETTILGVPCLTLRKNTERPVTTTSGTNRLVGTDPRRIVTEAGAILDADPADAAGRVPELWDGRAAERIAAIIVERILKE